MAAQLGSWGWETLRQGGLRFARRERMPWIAAVVALVLTLPFLSAGYVLDDLVHTYLLGGGTLPCGPPRPSLGLYRVAACVEGPQQAIDNGTYPWWSSSELKFAFFRPLSSLWRAADHGLWNNSAVMPHLETSLLYAGVVLAAAHVYRAWIGAGAAAGLAAIMFAIDDGHGVATVWIANRYTLLAALFGLMAIGAHIEPARSRIRSLLSPVLLALGLCAGETVLGAFAYLVAFAWLADPAGHWRGIARLVPHGVVIGLWAVAYQWLGYGSAGNRLYLDPAAQPLAFAAAAVERMPHIVLSLLAGFPSEAWMVLASTRDVARTAIVSTLAVALAIAVWRAARAHPGARSLAWGSLLAALPVCTTIPHDRLLLLPSFGAIGLVALAIERTWTAVVASRARRALAGTLAVIHLVLAPLLFPLRGFAFAAPIERFVERGARSLPGDEAIQDRTLLVIATPDVLMTTFMLLERFALAGKPGPASVLILSVQDQGEVVVTRTDERTLEIRNQAGQNKTLLTFGYRDRPFAAGEQVRVHGMQVEVLAVDAAAAPTALRFAFDDSLDGMTWVYWDDSRGFVTALPSPVGKEMRFHARSFLDQLR